MPIFGTPPRWDGCSFSSDQLVRRERVPSGTDLGGGAGRQQVDGRLHDVVEDDGRQHRREEQRREVVVEVEDAAHGPERHVVQQPADVEPAARVESPRLQTCDFQNR